MPTKTESQKTYKKELDVALGVVREAAVLTAAVQSQITLESLDKKDKSPVTIADYGSQALVCRAISRAFPADSIVAEEDSGDLTKPQNALLLRRLIEVVQGLRPAAEPEAICDWIDRGNGEPSDRFWTLDPIDGTKGFLRKEQYAISLCLIEGGELKIAVLACPRLPTSFGKGVGVLLSAVAGLGAFELSMEPEGGVRKIAVSAVADVRKLRFCESVESAHSSHSDSERIAAHLGITAPPVRMDSQAKYAAVGRGDAEAYLRLPQSQDYQEKIWDHAGGALVVTEAGGRVTDVLGQPLSWKAGKTLAQNKGVVVTNGHVHESLLSAMETLSIGRASL
ncbi:MAG: 3'(2'),5'-bisphosphate nucleotidase [Myxococcota bacterium]|nr:3'(2'),5'-bisphosphate nucleotidase [Myxococcota bacterium]